MMNHLGPLFIGLGVLAWIYTPNGDAVLIRQEFYSLILFLTGVVLFKKKP